MKDYSYILPRLKKACDFLIVEKAYTQKRICEELNAREESRSFRSPEKFIGESTLSSYYTAKDFGRGINATKGWAILKALERLILSICSFAWDEDSKGYVNTTEISSDKHSEKLLSLGGRWEAFSWDLESSKNHEIGYVHVFKLAINGINNIKCSTQGTDFENGRMYFISFDKVCIELSNTIRKVFLMIPLGSVEAKEIKNIKKIKLAYVDSGQYTIRTGVVAMRRTEAEFDAMECESRPVSQYSESWKELNEILENKQIIIT